MEGLIRSLIVQAFVVFNVGEIIASIDYFCAWSILIWTRFRRWTLYINGWVLPTQYFDLNLGKATRWT